MLANRQHLLERGSASQGALAGALDDRTVSEGITERNPELDHVGTSVNRSQDDVARGGEVGIATGYVSDEGRLFVKVKGHEKWEM